MKNITKKLLSRLALFLAVVFVFEGINSSNNVVNAQIIVPETKYVFDANYYANAYPEVAATYGKSFSSLLNHYITIGKWEGRAAYEGAPTFQIANDDASLALVTDSEASVLQQAAINTSLVQPVDNSTTALQGTDDGIYKALFIGNSITIHPLYSNWWGSWGMAATAPEKDYVHQTVSKLTEVKGPVDYDIVGFSSWERDNVRSKILPNLDNILAKDYDLVVVQVGDNVKNTKHFESDYETLVQYIKKSVPTAKVVCVGDFWRMSGRDAMKSRVADRQQCSFIDLSSIKTSSRYTIGMGARVLGDDGRGHRVNDYAVSIHPNDIAMEYIANGIAESVKSENIQIIVDEN